MVPTGWHRTPCLKAWFSPTGWPVLLRKEPEREWGGTQLVRAVPSTAVAPDLGAPNADHDCEPLRDQMRQIMTSDVGLTRTEARLTHAKRALGRVARQIPPGSVAHRESGTGCAAHRPGGTSPA
jgi:hypothetical protein